jgi:hypothetical protein
MDSPYEAGADVHVLPANFPIPGIGVLPINAYVLKAEEPVLIDTGVGIDRDDFIEAVSSIIDLPALKWVWLTHDDADHTGNIARIFELAPNARLVTNAFSAMRMATWWQVPLDRVHAIRPGDTINVGDRTLRAVSPPAYDNPLSIGIVDQSTGALFSVDAFGALLPEPTENVADVPPEALAGGMVGWATSDSPWLHTIDRDQFGGVLDRVRKLEPTHVFSSHLPAASGDSLAHFLQVLESVPDADPFVPPNAEEFSYLIAALTAQDQPPVAAT